jgi:hypothetical protein
MPFQRSISGTSPEPRWLLPTAVHALGKVHEAPVKTALLPTSTVGWIAHFVPFRRSASVLFPALPTARQNLTLGHETAASDGPPGAEGKDWAFHLMPFQRAATYLPTAVQA